MSYPPRPGISPSPPPRNAPQPVQQSPFNPVQPNMRPGIQPRGRGGMSPPVGSFSNNNNMPQPPPRGVLAGSRGGSPQYAAGILLVSFAAHLLIRTMFC
jgi:hypothetical protein